MEHYKQGGPKAGLLLKCYNFYIWQEAQLSQRDRAMLRVIIRQTQR